GANETQLGLRDAVEVEMFRPRIHWKRSRWWRGNEIEPEQVVIEVGGPVDVSNERPDMAGPRPAARSRLTPRSRRQTGGSDSYARNRRQPSDPIPVNRYP